jgi:predicted DNA-binding transcriptional regulator YafY
MNYSNKIKLIQQAIHMKQPLEIIYNEELETRKINPHCVYTSTKSIASLDAFQVSGNTNSVNDKFKIFKIDKIQSIKVLSKENFRIDNTFAPESPRYKDSFIKIQGVNK